jgi:hypothetical protein
MLEEELNTIGNNIAKKMTEMNLEAISSHGTEGQAVIKSEFWIPAKIADSTYTIKLSGSKIILESSSDPYVTIEVPFSSDIRFAENSTISSSDDRYELKYDSQSGSIFFLNGGVEPLPDFNAPFISIDSPPENAIIDNTTAINVSVWDDVGVTRVEYFVDEEYEYTARNPYNWSWDTTTMGDAIYNVTSVAYDAVGHSTPVTKRYNVSNGIKFPPVVTVLSPPEYSNTTFRKPVVQARISDNRGIDFSSISLFVDGVDKISKVTYANVSQKLTTITYTPSQDLNVSPPTHEVSLHVRDIEGSPETVKNWSFTIDSIIDTYDPATSIVSPVTNASLVSGSPISVTYIASDNGSGIENLSINVTRGDRISYYHLDNVSVYPTVINTINPPETWTFANTYVGGMNYTYNITVFDRSGRKTSATVGPLFLTIPAASELEVVTTGKTLTNGNTRIENITLRDIVPSDTIILTITKINVSWNSSAQKINRVKFDGNTKWSSTGGYIPSGEQFSGIQLTLTPSYTISGSSAIQLELRFTDNISGKAFTIVFLLSDGTTKTVTFNT